MKPIMSLSNPLMIAHAGGGIDGARYTNSLEAMDVNYANGFRFFEIDFSWTSDNELVCLHDWGKSFKLNFGYKTKQALSLKQFNDLVSKQKNIHPCTLKTLSNWVSMHPDVKIITDVKYNNISAIRLMLKKHPQLMQNLIPQFYQPDEYEILKTMGFQELIWILYQYEGKKSKIVELARSIDLLAISMRTSQAKKKWAQQLVKNNQPIFVYTINKIKTLKKLTKKFGVTGIYTDFLPQID